MKLSLAQNICRLRKQNGLTQERLAEALGVSFAAVSKWERGVATPDLALIAVVGRGMKSTRGTAGRIFSALAHKNINVKMIDQGSSELNIIIGVANDDFETAIKAIYDIFVITRL